MSSQSLSDISEIHEIVEKHGASMDISITDVRKKVMQVSLRCKGIFLYPGGVLFYVSGSLDSSDVLL